MASQNGALKKQVGIKKKGETNGLQWFGSVVFFYFIGGKSNRIE